jgi:uncharacterized membrane protein
MPINYAGANRMARRRKDESLVAVLLTAPWQVSAGFAVAVFIGLKWVVPSMASGNLFLKAFATPLSQLAWLFSGFFLLIAGIRYFKTAAANKRQSPETQAGPNPHDRPPTPADESPCKSTPHPPPL